MKKLGRSEFANNSGKILATVIAGALLSTIVIHEPVHASFNKTQANDLKLELDKTQPLDPKMGGKKKRSETIQDDQVHKDSQLYNLIAIDKRKATIRKNKPKSNK